MYTDKDGYLNVKDFTHPYAHVNGYVLLHRLIMEEHIGRYLEPHEFVHHKNENRQDNRIENLEVVTKARHNRIHFAADFTNRICVKCGSNKTCKSNKWYIEKDGFLCQKCYRMWQYYFTKPNAPSVV